MSTRAYNLTPADTMDFELIGDAVAVRATADAPITITTYYDEARAIAATTSPSAAATVVIEDRAMGRYVRIVKDSGTLTTINVLVEERT